MVFAHFADCPPKCEEFLRGDEDASFLEEVLRESGSAQNCGDSDSGFFQPQPKGARNSKMFGLDHDLTLGFWSAARQAKGAKYTAEHANCQRQCRPMHTPDKRSFLCNYGVVCRRE